MLTANKQTLSIVRWKIVCVGVNKVCVVVNKVCVGVKKACVNRNKVCWCDKACLDVIKHVVV